MNLAKFRKIASKWISADFAKFPRFREIWQNFAKFRLADFRQISKLPISTLLTALKRSTTRGPTCQRSHQVLSQHKQIVDT